MRNTNDNNNKEKILNKIHFLENQMISLDHHLPDTWEYLIKELDQQKKNLAKIEIEEHFASIDEDE
jgi:hypothetical protein